MNVPGVQLIIIADMYLNNIYFKNDTKRVQKHQNNSNLQ